MPCRFRLVSLALPLLVCGPAVRASADVLVTESFSYALGDIAGKGSATDGWTDVWTAFAGHSVVSKDLQYNAGELHINGGGLAMRISTTEGTSTASRPFNTISGGDTTYFSLLFRAETAPDNGNFIHFMLNNDTLNNNSAGIGDLTTTGTTFGARVGDSNGGDTTSDTTPYAADVTYLLVGKVEDVGGNNVPDQISLWVNPTTFDELSPGTTWTAVDTGSATAALNHFDHFTLRTLGLASGDFYYMDELRVGTTWASVVPEPASAGLLVVAAAGLLLRRRSARRVTSAT